MSAADPPPHPPDAWPVARRLARAVVRPVERFLGVEAASGVLLLVAALLGLVWANSPWRNGYEALLRAPIGLVAGPFAFTRPLSFWINDGLMVVFFFVAGLEIRREIHDGDLSSVRRAALPAAAALGGMMVPAIIYTALSRGGPAARGWGVPMATDIAFAVGVLALLGKRAPRGVRVLLLALAIIDDLGAIIVIAIFYSSGLNLSGILVAALGLAGVLALRAAGVRRSIAYLLPGAVLWAGFLRAGVHPTLAGVALGLMTPAHPWYGPRGFLKAVERANRDLRDIVEARRSHRELLGPLARVAIARREAVAPVVRLEAALHPWVAYGVMPIFALANAGVDLRGLALGDPVGQRIALGIVVGLVAGKPVGIIAASFAAERVGLAARPAGVTWGGVALVGVTAGIGFTMAIFIAGLAFEDPRLLGMAKLAVLVASLLAGALTLIVGRALLSGRGRDTQVGSPSEDRTERP